jgi:hypothetical protein
MARANPISREAAEQQWERFAEFYDIDPEFVPVDHRASYDIQKGHFIKAVCRGRLEVFDDAGGVSLRQHLEHPIRELKSVTYGTLTATAKLEMDKGNGRHQMIQYLLASLSGEPFVTFTKFVGVDQSTAEVVGALFSNV